MLGERENNKISVRQRRQLRVLEEWTSYTCSHVRKKNWLKDNLLPPAGFDSKEGYVAMWWRMV